MVKSYGWVGCRVVDQQRYDVPLISSLSWHPMSSFLSSYLASLLFSMSYIIIIIIIIIDFIFLGDNIYFTDIVHPTIFNF